MISSLCSQLLWLRARLQSGYASDADKMALVELLNRHGNLSDKQCILYKNRQDVEILNMAITIGNIILFGWLVGEAVDR